MIEIEKKYRIPQELADRISNLCTPQIPVKIEVERNTLYQGDKEFNDIFQNDDVYRIREIDGVSEIFTYKKSISNENGLKKKLEIEFPATPEFKEFMAKGLGLVPVLMYEKHRTTFTLRKFVICIDRLPFGLFLEIEGAEEYIEGVEKYFELSQYIETKSYPELTKEFGVKADGMFQASL